MLSRLVRDNTIELIENGTAVVLSITEEVVENTVVFKVSGALRNDLAYELDDEMCAAVSVGKNLRLDFSELNYIASASLKMLLRMQQKLDAFGGKLQMSITGVTEAIEKVFSDVGLSDLLRFE